MNGPDIRLLPNTLRRAITEIRAQVKIADRARDEETITYEQYETFQELVRAEVIPGGFI